VEEKRDVYRAAGKRNGLHYITLNVPKISKGTTVGGKKKIEKRGKKRPPPEKRGSIE